jgi:two-component system cell cycle sensor histidine kinase/response regulator CckA
VSARTNGRKPAERALRGSGEDLRRVFDESPVGMVTVGPDLRFITANPAFCRMLGYSEQELSALSLQDVTHHEHANQDAGAVQKLIDGRDSVYRTEKRYLRKDRGVIWGAVTATPVRDHEGRFLYALAVIENITERKLAEEALRENEEKFQYVFEHSPLGKSITLPSGEVSFNKAFSEMLGYSAEELRNRSWQELTHPDDIATTQARLHAILSGEKESERFVKRYLHKKGSIVWADAATSLRRDQAGNPLYFITSVIDITERTRAEEALAASEARYRRLFESARDGILILDATSGRVLDVNPFLVELLGYPRETLLGKELWQIGLFEDVASSQDAFRELQEKGYIRYEDLPLQASDGRRIDVEFVSNVYLVGAEKVVQCNIRDITTRKQGEEALKKERDLLDNLITTIPDSVYFKDRAGRFVKINAALARQFGLDDPSAAVGKTDFDFFSDEHAQEASADDRRVMATGQPLVAVEEKETWPDGRITWVSTTKVPIRDATAQVVGLVGISRDVTARKQMEQALRASEEQFRTIFELASVGMAQADLDGHFLRVNERFCRITGYSAAEVRRLRVPEITHPEDRARDWAAFQRVVRGEISEYRIEKRYLRKDGSHAWVNVNMTVLRDAAGQPTRTLAVIEDIAERKRLDAALRLSEGRLRTVFEGLTDGILITDLGTGSLVLCNPAICRMLGYSEDELLRLSVDDLHPAQDLPAVKEGLRRQVSGERPLAVGTPVRRKDGSTIIADINAMPLRLGDRECLLGIFRDMTSFHELEAQVRQAQKMEAIGLLAGGVAHDFNNVLGVIQGHCELMLKGLRESDPLFRSVSQIKASSERAATLTHQLLAFSRKQPLQPKVLDLNDTVRGLEGMLRRLIGENVKLTTALSEDLGRVQADPGQLEQVLINLTINARDAMPEGGKVVIETRDVELDAGQAGSHPGVEPGSHVMVAVTDNGCGMDAATQARIFEPFFTTKGIGRGTGLGLSTAYGIVKQSGGQIEVHSEPGRGATFRVYLPRAVGALADGQARAETKTKEERSKGETVLLVEDDEALRGLVAIVLEDLGYSVHAAANGGEALLTVEEEGLRPDLLLTDVIMPGMGGALLATRLRRTLPNLKVLYMSGYTEVGGAHLGGIEEGAPLIQKPFGRNALGAMVRAVLSSRGQG